MTMAEKYYTINDYKTYYLIKFPENGHIYQCIVEGKNNARALQSNSSKLIYSVQIRYDKIVYEEGEKPYPSCKTDGYEEWYVYNKDGVYFAEIETEDLETAKLLLEISNF